MPAFGTLLKRLSHIAKLRACKHIRSLWHPRHVRLVYKSGRLVNAFEGLKRMGAVDKPSRPVGVPVPSCFAPPRPKPPSRSLRMEPRLFGWRRKWMINCQIHPTGNRSKPKIFPHEGCSECAVMIPKKPCRYGEHI